MRSSQNRVQLKDQNIVVKVRNSSSNGVNTRSSFSGNPYTGLVIGNGEDSAAFRSGVCNDLQHQNSTSTCSFSIDTTHSEASLHTCTDAHADTYLPEKHHRTIAQSKYPSSARTAADGHL
eukprot:1185295-Prorocentrum_minimum.AAC.4